jgi:2'-5' RNA ligase
MNPTVYDEVWQSFITGDHISQGSIWGGEGLALVVPVAAPEILAAVEQIQAKLAEHLPFSPHLPETLHITLSLFGNPPGENLPTLSAFLRTALAPIPAFAVSLRRVNSFFRAPFFEVFDDGALNYLHKQIQSGLIKLGYPETDYGPHGQIWHVTLGTYTASSDGAAARSLLLQMREMNAGSFIVNELQLVKTSAGAPYRMETLNSFALSGQVF